MQFLATDKDNSTAMPMTFDALYTGEKLKQLKGFVM